MIKGLTKEFGAKKAVRGITMNIYNGQIFALLGHNGAGKTTTISMLNGTVAPTKGFAEVFGIDMFNNISECRKMFGICPQHDILFSNLTPIDHLRLYSSFKGTEPHLIDGQVDKMLKDIDLYAQRNQ
jgi:ABC-type multidrug transport system ATPase subunit